MKKLLLALPFVATATWAGTTLYSGSQTREAYDALLAQLDDMSTLAVSNESFSAGFAHSLAVTQVRTSNGPDGEILFRLRHEIDHTPFSIGGDGARVGAARIVTTLLLDETDEAMDELLSGFGGEHPLTLESDVGFDRRTDNALRIASFEHTGEGRSVEFAGARYDIALDPDGRMVAEGHFDGATLIVEESESGPAVRMDFGAGRDSWDVRWVEKAVYTGTQRTALESLKVLSQGVEVRLGKVRLDGDSALEDERFASAATVEVGSIDVAGPGGASIPSLPISSFSIGARLGGLDLSTLGEQLETINGLYLVDPETSDPAELFAALGDAYGAMIVPGASLGYDVTLRNAGGEARASTTVLFEGDGSPSGHDAITTVGELARALKLTASLEADAEAVAMTPAAMFLAGDALAPWIVSDGADYRSEVVVDDLIVDINGNPLSLELMAGDVLAMPLDASLLMMLPQPPAD